MPTVTEREVQGYGWCKTLNPDELDYCPGNEQTPLVLIEQEVQTFYGDSASGSEHTGAGKDGSSLESSRLYYRVRDEGDALCPHCGERRQVDVQQRPVYLNLSGRPPDEIFRRRRRAKEEAERLAAGEQMQSAELTAMREMVTEQGKQISQLTDALIAQAKPRHTRADG